jgi:MYXO-CTERM domain-containing protein
MKISFTIPFTRTTHCALLVLLSSLLIPAVAGAIVGDEPSRYAPGTRAERIAHPAIQERLNQAAPWLEFLDRRGGAWTVSWDEATRTPVRFWGTGWEVGAADLADDTKAFAIGWQILAEEHALLGDVDFANLEELVVDRRDGITTVTFARTYASLLVADSRISLRFKHGRFVMGQFESMPGIADQLASVPAPGLDKTAARSAALAALGWSPAKTAIIDDRLAVLPLLSETAVSYRLAWQIEMRSLAFPSHRIVWIDARSGEFLRWDELVRFAAGTVYAETDDRYPENGRATQLMVDVELESETGSIEVDAMGNFEIADELGPTEITWTAGSRWFRVRNLAGGGPATFSGVLDSGDGALLATPDEDLGASAKSHVDAQLGGHIGAHKARAKALEINPNFAWASYRVDVNVNLDGACNAYFDGDINFLQRGSGCNNTGRVHDVVVHEYGHGFHAYSIIEGAGSFDGAMGEGLSDYLSATVSGDPATARGFFSNSDQPLRDIAPNHVWPRDIGEIHYTGIIIAGALWDTRVALEALYGDDGIHMADLIFGGVAARATDIPSAYAEALLVNDDDGNLGNGTPDKCLIDDQFGLHGLGPAAPGAPLFTLLLQDLESSIDAGSDLPIELSASLTRPDCSTGEVSEVLVHWTHGSGDLDDFSTISLDALGGGEYAGVIPAAEAGTLVRYTIEVLDGNGSLAGALPTGSITDPWFATWVGGPAWEEIFFADFEADDGDFTHSLISGPVQDGADDWQWGTPAGTGGDPGGAFSGSRAWGNDLGIMDNWNGLYQPDIHNVLRSPVIDIPADAIAVELQFRRWLTVEDGYWDGAFVSINGERMWVQHGSAIQDDASNHHVDGHWAFRSYDVTDLVQPGGTLEAEWEIVSDGGLQLGGWNLDDVAVVVLRGDVGPDGEPVDGPGGIDGEGCACNSASASAPRSLALLLLVGLPAILRRRR